MAKRVWGIKFEIERHCASKRVAKDMVSSSGLQNLRNPVLISIFALIEVVCQRRMGRTMIER